MIILTRLGGHQVAVNPDLIERAEPTPDTVLTMLDGRKLVVAESVPHVVDAVRTWRASIAAEAFGLSQALTATESGVRRGTDRYSEALSEMAAEDVAAHSVLGASLARVLRLPVNERDGEG